MNSCLIDKLDKLTVLVIKTSFKKIALITPNDINQINYAYIFTTSLLTCAPYLFEKLNSDNELLNDSNYQYYRQNVNLSEINRIYKKYSEESKNFYGGWGGDDSADNGSKNLLWWWLFGSVEDSFTDLLGEEKPTPSEKQTISVRFLVITMMFNVIIAGPAQRIQAGKAALSDANIRRLYDLNTGRGIRRKKSYFSAQPQDLEIKFDEYQESNGSGQIFQAQPYAPEEPLADDSDFFTATAFHENENFFRDIVGDAVNAKGKKGLEFDKAKALAEQAFGIREALENKHGFCGHEVSLFLGAPLDHIAYEMEVSANKTISKIGAANSSSTGFPERGTWLGESWNSANSKPGYQEVLRRQRFTPTSRESHGELFRRAATTIWNDALKEQFVKQGDYLAVKVGFTGHARVMLVTSRGENVLYGFADLNYLGDAVVTQTCTDLGLKGGNCDKVHSRGQLFMTEPNFFTQTAKDSMPSGSISETVNPQIEACTKVESASKTETKEQICENKLTQSPALVIEAVTYSNFQKILNASTTPGGALSITLDRIISFSEMVKTQVSRIVDTMRTCPKVASKYQKDDAWVGIKATKPNPKKWAYKSIPGSLVPAPIPIPTPTPVLRQSLNPPVGWKNVETKSPDYKDEYKAPNGDVWSSFDANDAHGSHYIKWKKQGNPPEYLKNEDFEKKFYPPLPPPPPTPAPSHYIHAVAQDEITATPLWLSHETFLHVRQDGESPSLIIPEFDYFEALDEPVLEESQPTVGLNRTVSAPVGTSEDLPIGRPRSKSIGGKFKITKRRRFKTIKKTKRNRKQKKTRRNKK